MTDNMKNFVGKLSRRAANWIAGALGAGTIAAALQSEIGLAILQGLIAAILSGVAEWFSERHDTKLVVRAVDFALNAPDGIDATIAGVPSIDEMKPAELKAAVVKGTGNGK